MPLFIPETTEAWLSPTMHAGFP